MWGTGLRAGREAVDLLFRDTSLVRTGMRGVKRGIMPGKQAVMPVGDVPAAGQSHRQAQGTNV